MPPLPEKKPDPASFLLPKKETGPNPDSAQRINAGALLEQEQNATLPKLESATPPAPKVDQPEVSPLQTYRGDVEKSVSERGVSVVSVAAAEADRRGKQGRSSETQQKDRRILGANIAMTSAGVVLVVLAVGVVSFIFLRPTSVEGPQTLVAPLISVDETAVVPSDTSSRDATVANIAAAVQGARLSLGLVEWLYVAPPTTGTPQQLTVQELLSTIAPNVPPNLLRTLQPTYLLGVHSFDENQAFLLLQTDSYETAYSGMLGWEYWMYGDLKPIFNRKPSVQLTTNTDSSATSTVASNSAQFFNTGFVDKVVENRDARVILNDKGDLLLLWTMLGRNLILITTNEYTLREVVSRINVAPVVPIPSR